MNNVYDLGEKVKSPQHADFVTVARSSSGLRLTKRWYHGATGPECETYEKAKTFDFSEAPVACLADLARIIGNAPADTCLIFGRLKPGIDPRGALRRLHDHKDGPATIEDAAHHWLPIDIDNLDAQDDRGEFDPIADPARAVACIVSHLPVEFTGADCLWQQTSSAGFKPGIRMRLYFWLDRPITGAEAKAWLAGPGSIVDGSIYTPTQPIYVAPPIFDVVADPVPQRVGTYSRGRAGTVTPPAVIEARQAAPREAAEGIELDTEKAIRRGQAYLGKIAAAGAMWGEEDEATDTYQIAAKLKDFGLSEMKVLELLAETIPDELDWLAVTVSNAYRYGQNAPGSDARPDNTEALAAVALAYAAEHGPATGGRTEDELEEFTGDEEAVEWLWEGWLAAGMLHTLAGTPDDGKSTIAGADFAARITTGGTWPDGTRAPLGDVVMWSGEDDPAKTLLPRFLAAGGDRRRFHIPSTIKSPDGEARPFDPATDTKPLLKFCQRWPGLKLIVIDPVSMVLSAHTDGRSNAGVRRDLSKLFQLAQSCGAAVLGLTHFTKFTDGKKAIDRIIDSRAFGAAPRVVMATAVEAGTDRRRIVRVKGNIVRERGGGFDYILASALSPKGQSMPKVEWHGKLTGEPNALLAELEPKKEPKETLEMQARTSILSALAEGPAELHMFYNTAAEMGIGAGTVDRARRGLSALIEEEDGRWRLRAAELPW